MFLLILRWLAAIVIAFLIGKLLKKDRGTGETLAILLGMIALTSAIGYLCNTYLMPSPLLNFMLMGMAFSATFANMVSDERLGARLGAKATKMENPVQKYLGFTLLPHSGVSLVFTGIAVSILSTAAPDCAEIIQGTIAAAAVINEIIAVVVAKKGFEWAGEIPKA